MPDPTDIVTRLRLTPVLMYGDEFNQNRIDYEACKKYINNEGVKMMREASDEIERLRKELDEARMRTGRILNEIDCRIEHGAESNGHLEAIHNLFKENNNA